MEADSRTTRGILDDADTRTTLGVIGGKFGAVFYTVIGVCQSFLKTTIDSSESIKVVIAAKEFIKTTISAREED
jgi:hypothetical protein